MNELKQMPRDAQGRIKRTFEANGVEYTIRDISEVLSPKRYLEFSRFSSIFGFGHDFASLIEHFKECKRMILEIDKNDSLTRMRPLLKIEAIENAIIESSEMKYDASMYLCAIFITSKDEDIKVFDFEEQTKKIDNWNNEGFMQSDFLALAGISVNRYSDVYQEITAEIANRNISL